MLAGGLPAGVTLGAGLLSEFLLGFVMNLLLLVSIGEFGVPVALGGIDGVTQTETG